MTLVPYHCEPCKEFYCCPICNAKPSVKRHRSDRIKGTTVSAELAAVKPTLGIELEPNSASNPYYDCKSCRNEYEDISGARIENITDSLKVKKNVTKTIKRIYGKRGLDTIKIGLTQLMHDYRTGIITGKSHILTKFFNSLRRNRYKIKVCICFNNRHAFISLQRKKDRDGFIYFEALTIGVP